MKKLHLLFTKDGLQYQISKGKLIKEENAYFTEEDAAENFIETQLNPILEKEFSEISVISALNHFSMMPENFKEHEMGYQLIAYNAAIDKDNEELMLSVNKRFGVQFYYTFPRQYYTKIKALGKPVRFNFSGEKFLNCLHPKSRREVHINLYHQQCEFFAFDNQQLVLYNNLDIDSEVDFLYFILFTLDKIGFGRQDTHFFVYGETTENETFISELRKFVKYLKIIFDNIPKQHFIMQTSN